MAIAEEVSSPSSSSSDLLLLRFLGAHERYSLIRHNIGYPPVICCVAVGRGDDELVNRVRLSLHKKISTLLETDGQALLSAHIYEPRSKTPRYARRTKGVTVDQVFQCVDERVSLEPNSLLDREIDRGIKAINIEKAPLWSVRLLRESGNRFAIAITCHHLIVDGRGMANLQEVLVCSSDEVPPMELLSGGITSLNEIPVSVHESVPGYELGMMKKVATKVVFMLPASIRNMLDKPIEWPAAKDVLVHPTNAKDSHYLISLKGGDLVRNLKQQANKHGIKTINPLINTACLIALYTILPHGIEVKHDCALNERVPNKRHTLCTGNYISAHVTSTTLSDDADVWKETHRFAQGVLSGRGAARGIFAELGYMLTLMQDMPFKPTPQYSSPIDAFLSEKQSSNAPHRGAFGLSNLGAIKGVPPYIEDVYWSQLCSPIGAPIGIHVCGFGDAPVKREVGVAPAENAIGETKGGLSVTVGLRRGVIGVEKEDAFIKAVKSVLLAFEAGRIEEGCTFEEASRLIIEKVVE